jgi:CHASE3 domain sensor protein
MNSRLIRLLIVIIAIVIGLTTGYFLQNIDNDINAQRTSTDALRDQAAALTSTIADVRAGQFAYVARGQGEAFWISYVESLIPALQKQAAEFSALLTAPAAHSAFEETTAALDNFRTLDSKVRAFVQSGNSLLASDMIFSDGLESMATASAQVSAALQAEVQHRNGSVEALRARQLAVGGGGAGIMLLMIVGLAFSVTSLAHAAPEPQATPVPPVEPVRFEAPLPKARAAVTPRLLNTAQLCAELARVTESRQLPSVLERAAKVLDASGIILWVAEPSRQRLVPALFHGYEAKIISRMGSIHREANNAAAAAYRSSEVRTVAGDSFTSAAVIVPLMTSDGCVGVMSAEMKSGSEKDESAQAFATIFASQLATLVATPTATAIPFKAVAQA